MDVSKTAEWQRLQTLAQSFDELNLRTLFEQDNSRAKRLTFQVGDLLVDLSKHLVTDEILEALTELAKRTEVSAKTEAMMSGEHINSTEERSALHTALRAPNFASDPKIAAEVEGVLKRMGGICGAVRSGAWRGQTGRQIRNVVNIGIGGSDLGPAMAYRALAPYRYDRIRCHFVSSLDGADLQEVLEGLDAAETLFVVVSKTFTTAETLINAKSARAWLAGALGSEAVARHFIAVSSNEGKALEFGVARDHYFEMAEWVGGRYSLGSAVGISLMMAFGADRFGEMLEGMHLIDKHFFEAPPLQNVPMLTGLIALWYRTFCNLQTRAVIPYSHSLRRFPAYLQQLEMESNGKSVRLNGDAVDYETGAIVWGEPGTNSQHSFHQLLHQGTTIVPCDFIAFANPQHSDSEDALDRQALLVANCLAQAEALAFGHQILKGVGELANTELAPHKSLPINRPSTVIMAPRLTASVLGQLIALYEHQVFTQGVVWGINSFDQFGVELGKSLATDIAKALDGKAPPSAHDLSTSNLINHHQSLTH